MTAASDEAEVHDSPYPSCPRVSSIFFRRRNSGDFGSSIVMVDRVD